MKHFDEYLDYSCLSENYFATALLTSYFFINWHLFLQEYSLIMSERDTFHKEMEKLQDEVFIYLRYRKSVKA